MRHFAFKVPHALIAGLCLALIASAAQGSTADPRLRTEILGQTSWLAGSQAALRIITEDGRSGKPLPNAIYRISLEGGTNSALSGRDILAIGETDSTGTADTQFQVPSLPNGGYQLHVETMGLGEYDSVTQAVSLQRSSQVLLTTDKPLYQPGQIIHIRALALNVADLSPRAGAPLTLEVEDGKGNIVFKQVSTTSPYGVGFADFQLADEVNLGSYRVRATLDDTTSEKSVTVDRYVLPKFKVTFQSDRPFYAPGQTLAGDVQADYFFGKPVQGKVEITLSRFDVGFTDFATIDGTLDATGHFKFTQALPAYFVGQPLAQGDALVRVQTVVTDSAGHPETVTDSLPVAKGALKVTLVPESPNVTPGVPNVYYVVTTTPDGQPAKTHVTIQSQDGSPPVTVDSDAGGIAAVKLTPTSTTLNLKVTVSDDKGDSGTVTGNFYNQFGDESILLRTNAALYQVGQTMQLTVIAPSKDGTVYIDLTKNNQTVLTKSADLSNGSASLAVDLAPELAGTVQVHAYRFSQFGQVIRDTRTVFISPASDLTVTLTPDQASYRPGGIAHVAVHVADKSSAGVAAAVGLSIVDESVFALEDKNPGLAKVFFLLEQEILDPKYQINGIDPGPILEPPILTPQPNSGPIATDSRQRAATVLFAGLPDTGQFTFAVDTYSDKTLKAEQTWLDGMKQDAQVLANAMTVFKRRFGRYPSVREGWHKLITTGLLKWLPVDRWGHWYLIQPPGNGSYAQGFHMTSAGPDGKLNTADDYHAYWLPGNPPYVYGPSPPPGIGGVGGGPFRGGGIGGGVFIPGVSPVDVAGGANGVPILAPAAPPTTPTTSTGTSAAPTVRVRQFFPETLFWNPSLITDASGNATVDVPLADSITTWRMSALASSGAGAIGSVDAPLLVFQPFFVDIDFPVSLTQDDDVTVPVSVYNYLSTPQTVSLQINQEPWFTLSGSATQQVTLGPNEVKGASFQIHVTGLGHQAVTVTAIGSQLSDAVRRDVEVMPDGKRVDVAINDRLDGTQERTLTLPDDAIDGASDLLVKVYPGVFSQVIENLDAIFQMPYGCFEQTSSTTYPNVLALNYLKQTGKNTPEVQAKAEGYINLGYQRLLTFEVSGGGFSWFGDAPANKILTAYGLMEFADMARVHPVDPAVISRTQAWLAQQQQPDGHWDTDKVYISDGLWNILPHNELMPTAYITWALLESGYTGPEPAKGIAYLKSHLSDAQDAGMLALMANAFVAAQDPAATDVFNKLMDLKTEANGKVYWTSSVETFSFARPGTQSGNVEVTATVALALINSGQYPDMATKALAYLVSQKDPRGTWYSTQATVLSLKALVASLTKAQSNTNMSVQVLVNGQQAGSFNITPADSDVLRQVDAKQFVKPGDNDVRLEVSGTGDPLFSITGSAYRPWANVPPDDPTASPMAIKVDYDRTTLAQNDTVTSTVTVAYNGPGTAENVIVDLGIPPAFDVQTDDLDALVKAGAIEKYSMTGRQIILYFSRVQSGTPVTFSYHLKAKYPITATVPASDVYLYYNPEIRGTAPPIKMVVN